VMRSQQRCQGRDPRFTASFCPDRRRGCWFDAADRCGALPARRQRICRRPALAAARGQPPRDALRRLCGGRRRLRYHPLLARYRGGRRVPFFFDNSMLPTDWNRLPEPRRRSTARSNAAFPPRFDSAPRRRTLLHSNSETAGFSAWSLRWPRVTIRLLHVAQAGT
jgi:hypothetical protein